MENKKQKKKGKWKQYLGTICFLLIGAFCGFGIASYMDQMDSAGKSLSEILLGAGLKDMPEEWFVMPSDEDLKKLRKTIRIRGICRQS